MKDGDTELTSVYEAGSTGEAYLIRDMLIDNEVHAVVSGEYSEAAPIAPITDGPQVQVRAADRQRALELVEAYERDTIHDDPDEEPPAGAPWTCPKCGEPVDANFEVCWNCEAPRPSDPDANADT